MTQTTDFVNNSASMLKFSNRPRSTDHDRTAHAGIDRRSMRLADSDTSGASVVLRAEAIGFCWNSAGDAWRTSLPTRRPTCRCPLRFDRFPDTRRSGLDDLGAEAAAPTSSGRHTVSWGRSRRRRGLGTVASAPDPDFHELQFKN